MKLRIVSDGTAAGTKVCTEDGQVVEGVQLISFQSSADGAPEAFLHVMPVQADIVVDARAHSTIPHLPFDVQDEPFSELDMVEFFNALKTD